MRRLETMAGRGIVTSRSGEKVAVCYDLRVCQDQPDGKTPDRRDATIVGTKRIEGMVEPVCFFEEYGLILEMEDGRKLRFFFTNGQGYIAANSWIV
jgi:hypothetical protein